MTEFENNLLISPNKAGSLVVNVRLVDEVVDDCILIRPPKFNTLDEGGIGFEYFDEILASGSNSNENLLLEYFYKSGIDTAKLNIIYADSSGYRFDNFIHFSSAEEQVLNFFYKIQLLETYDEKINELLSISGSEFNISARNERLRYIENKRTLIGGFTGFEKFLYSDNNTIVSYSGTGYSDGVYSGGGYSGGGYSGGDSTLNVSSTAGLSYPGAGSILSGSSTDIVVNWYNEIILQAGDYDKNNVHILMNNIPEYLKIDDENLEFITFLNMIGHHFDIIWMYINSIKNSKIIENKQYNGIIDELIYPFLTAFGWDADIGSSSQLLWLYAFGVDVDGNPNTEFSGKEYRNQIWRRILNNLPYILKHKGTRRALNAVMACYGIPESILSIMEFGGPIDDTIYNEKTYTYQDTSVSLVFKNNSKLFVDWKEYVDTSQYPNAVELRLNSQYEETQNIVTNPNAWGIDFIPTRTFQVNAEASAGIVKFSISGSGTLHTASTPQLNLYSDTFTQVLLNREVGSTTETYTIYAYEGFIDRVRSKVSASVTVPTGSVNWSGQDQIIVGDGFFGNLDEVRLWSEPLNDRSLENHTLFPDAIDGNDIQSSTDDLLLRLDFEYPKDRNLDPYIKNVAYNQTYTEFVTASNFDSAPEYPYQHEPYERSVTAKIPLNTYTFSNKVRFENPVIDENITLSSKYSVTRNIYDRSAIDSNRLGVFLSQNRELNLDIIKSFNNLFLDDYIGNPADQYEDRYKDLDGIRKYYFERINLDTYEYVSLIKYIDKSIFEVLKKLVPARSRFTTGLLYEPHLLERSKFAIYKKPIAEYRDIQSNLNIISDVTPKIETNKSIIGLLDIEELTNISGLSNIGIETSIQTDDLIEITTDHSSNLMLIYESSDDVITGQLQDFELVIDIDDENKIQSKIEDLNYIISHHNNPIISSSFSDLHTEISTDNDTEVFMRYGDLLMFPKKFEVNGLSSYIYNDLFKIIDPGLRDLNNLNISGAGLYGKGSHTIITRFANDGTIIKERKKVFILKCRYNVTVNEIISPFNVSTNGYDEFENVVRERFRFKLSILNFEQPDPIVSGEVVEVLPLNGYLPQHYRYTGDLPTGLQNSYFNGSVQTSATTTDGKSPVEIFLTNPNILRVNDTGRGSGEPILVVD